MTETGHGGHQPVIVFDHHSDAFAGDPYRVANELRERCPIGFSESYGGFWVIVSHALATEAFRDHETYSSASGVTIPDLAFGTTHLPITTDPPELLQYRRFLTERLSKEAIARHEAELKRIITGMVAALAERGSWDFVADMGSIVPGVVTLTLLGLPASRRVEFSTAMARGMEHAGTNDPELAAQIERDRIWMTDQIAVEISRRRGAPADDLFSHLVHGRRPDGRQLSDAEIVDIAMNLLIGGFHTTNSALASCVVELQRRPDLRHRLIADPSLIDAFVEEIVRVYAPATGMARTVTRDHEVDGTTVRAGEKVYLFIMAANRDPGQFRHPDVVDIDRDTRGGRSLAWGWGVHRCIGIHLARMILRLELQAILELMPGYTIDLAATRLSHEIGISYMHAAMPASL
jgi:cytochrome P450